MFKSKTQKSIDPSRYEADRSSEALWEACGIPRPAASALATELSHLDGVPWWEAPVPKRWHKCEAQTFGWSRLLYVERCACGAIGSGGPRPIWLDRNSRKPANV